MNDEKNSIFPRKVEKWNGKWNEIRKNGTEKFYFPPKIRKNGTKKF